MNEVEVVLSRLGFLRYLETHTHNYTPVGDRALNCYIHPVMLPAFMDELEKDPRFYRDMWWRLHREVGTHLISFRSLRGVTGAIDDLSMQIVFDTVTGKFYADLDRYNTQDVVNVIGHLIVEVIPWPWRRRFTWENTDVAV